MQPKKTSFASFAHKETPDEVEEQPSVLPIGILKTTGDLNCFIKS